MKQPQMISSLSLSLLCGWIIAGTCACSSCDTKSDRPSESPYVDNQVKPCLKVGEQCRLRPGALGVCLPGAPTKEDQQGLFPIKDRLICTPQH